ncbi:hypothetical protein BC739_003928 [Kutzneria viridogrisea]|uniref:DUF4334 domain-containing protein n=2 Tax=Kutzneria viridogrisea TaxID=47990 RepID=A0ABR6BJ96_9PSEU|nr:hypothetical protein [Kutzneria viridogrisea]
MAMFDHVKRVEDNTLMGVMNGKPGVVLANGRHFHFGLEREGGPQCCSRPSPRPLPYVIFPGL